MKVSTVWGGGCGAQESILMGGLLIVPGIEQRDQLHVGKSLKSDSSLFTLISNLCVIKLIVPTSQPHAQPTAHVQQSNLQLMYNSVTSSHNRITSNTQHIHTKEWDSCLLASPQSKHRTTWSS